MSASLQCPRCCYEAWARGAVVILPGPGVPLRVTTHCASGPDDWTCANCGYVAPAASALVDALELVPPRPASCGELGRHIADATTTPAADDGAG